MKLYVGNLPRDGFVFDDLRALVSDYPQVEAVELPLDDAHEPRGFGFVTVPDPVGANVIATLHGQWYPQYGAEGARQLICEQCVDKIPDSEVG